MYFFNVFIPSFMSPIILAVNYRSRDTMEGRAGRQRILVLVYRSRDTIEGEIKALGRKRECDGYMGEVLTRGSLCLLVLLYYL